MRKKVIAYVKDEEFNINAMTYGLKFIMNYESLGLEESFQRTCFGHTFSKACQYGTTKKKVGKNLKYVSINFPRTNSQKCIT